LHFIMIQAYIDAAMERAHYEMFDDESIYGEIPDCPGVFANEATLEQCRRTLEEVLEGWILLRLQEHLELPVIAGISLQAPVLA
jgi:predicted RNase H-like HicB family nuclease